MVCHENSHAENVVQTTPIDFDVAHPLSPPDSGCVSYCYCSTAAWTFSAREASDCWTVPQFRAVVTDGVSYGCGFLVDGAIDCCKKMTTRRWNCTKESAGGRVADGGPRQKCPYCFHFHCYSRKKNSMMMKKKKRRRK